MRKEAVPEHGGLFRVAAEGKNHLPLVHVLLLVLVRSAQLHGDHAPDILLLHKVLQKSADVSSALARF